jgi:heme-degrading monooxygenase HmoA
MVDRIVLFGAIARRPPRRYEKPPTTPAWRIVTVEDQWARFVEDVPPHEQPVLSRAHFDEWSERYLDTDPDSRGREPAGVKTPTGPFTDILHAWHGNLAYDPARVQAPVAIIRGEWDGLIGDEDARWLFDAFTASPIKRDIKISRGTHLMHLEAMRYALYRESIAFLEANDKASVPQAANAPCSISRLARHRESGPLNKTKEESMFSVIFEVLPKTEQWDTYLGNAKMLRPELERVDGFIDNIRYRSLTREGWILSLSGWRDEKSVVRWRTRMRHHEAQEKGRSEILLDYHLRVGQLTQDTRLPEGYALHEQRLDETEVGAGTTVTLIDAKRPPEWVKEIRPEDVARWLGLAPNASGLVAWDVFNAVLTPGDIILLMSWHDTAAAEAFEGRVSLQDGARLRRVRVVRDYGMFDRREAPQYYPDITRSHTDRP